MREHKCLRNIFANINNEGRRRSVPHGAGFGAHGLHEPCERGAQGRQGHQGAPAHQREGDLRGSGRRRHALVPPPPRSKLINSAVFGKVPPISPAAINIHCTNIYHKIENLNLSIESARSIGCTVVNITPSLIMEKREHIILGLIWQIIKVPLLTLRSTSPTRYHSSNTPRSSCSDVRMSPRTS
jgi:hypothetical protein